MTIMDMLGQSGVLSLLGMSVVFGFLIIMVISVTLMGKIIHALGLDKDVTQPRAQGGQFNAGSSAAKSTAVAAAITAAVTEYQKNEQGGKNA